MIRAGIADRHAQTRKLHRLGICTRGQVGSQQLRVAPAGEDR